MEQPPLNVISPTTPLTLGTIAMVVAPLLAVAGAWMHLSNTMTAQGSTAEAWRLVQSEQIMGIRNGVENNQTSLGELAGEVQEIKVRRERFVTLEEYDALMESFRELDRAHRALTTRVGNLEGGE